MNLWVARQCEGRDADGVYHRTFLIAGSNAGEMQQSRATDFGLLDSAGCQHLLGTDGNHDHARAVRGDASDSWAFYALWFRVATTRAPAMPANGESEDRFAPVRVAAE
jgi:hypothetical protein